MLALALWVSLNALIQLVKNSRLSQWAMVIAHVGVAVTIIGISLSTAYSEQRNLSMEVGDQVAVGPYKFQLMNLANMTGPNYHGVVASIQVEEQGRLVSLLHPEQRIYEVSKSVKAKTDIRAGLFSDLYVALGTPLDKNAWSVRIYYKPFVRWIWGGGILMMLGGIIGVIAKRRRYHEA